MKNVRTLIRYPSTCSPQEIADLERKFRRLLKNFKAAHSDANTRRIEDAWGLAVRAHGKLFLRHDKRKSGEHYVHHLLDVAEILVGWGVDGTTIVAGILHDCVEDTDVTIDEIALQFGDIVGGIVAGLTKLNAAASVTKEDRQADYIRRMLKAMQGELRVPIIKLADRLHNMRTLSAMPPDKRIRIAKETLDVYCPLAHTLGMGLVRRELEDHAFRFSDEERYIAISAAVAGQKHAAQRDLMKIQTEMKAILERRNIDGHVEYGRLKSNYAIHEYLIHHELTLAEIKQVDNFIKLIVVCETENDCYDFLPHLRRGWPKNEYSMARDGIAVPRRNGFSALIERRRVIGGLPFEVQIFTRDAFRLAEYGITAEWNYRPARAVALRDVELLTSFESSFRWMLEISDPVEFLASFRSELNSREIYVYTKNKRRIYLPEYSTPVDLAYHVSSSLGNEATGCMVNGESYSLTAPLRTGDVVEILSAKGVAPREEWLKYVKTSRAKEELRRHFRVGNKSEFAAEAVKRGARALARAAKLYNCDVHTLEHLLPSILERYGLHSVTELYRDVGFGKISKKEILDLLFPPSIE
jgi:GTP pyrophosphokinase